MELLFLGTGPAEAIPRLGHDDVLCRDALLPASKSRRLRSAAVLRSGDIAILIDAGPDIAYQLASHRIQHLDAVLLTHAHLDAAGGLRQLSEWATAVGRKLSVFTERATEQRYGTFPNLEYCFVEPGEVREYGGVPAEFLRVEHSLQPGFPTFGFRFGSLAYASDIAGIPEPALDRLRGVRTFVLDAAFWFGQKYRGHLTPDKAVAYAVRLGVEHLILTQTGHTYPPHDEAERELRDFAKREAPALRLTLAYDGLILKA